MRRKLRRSRARLFRVHQYRQSAAHSRALVREDRQQVEAARLGALAAAAGAKLLHLQAVEQRRKLRECRSRLARHLRRLKAAESRS